VTIQRNFRHTYRTEASTDKSVTRLFTQFKEMGSVEKQKSTGRLRTSEQIVDCIRQSCVRSPKISIARCSLELGVPKTTIQNVLHKHLRLHTYKIQPRHGIKVTDRPKRVKFANFMLSEIDDNEGYLQRVMFTDEATFHINCCVNRYNCKIWGLWQPNEFFEYVRDTPKVNMWCGLLHDRVVGSFFFVERTITH
jgi:hypothetical protein